MLTDRIIALIAILLSAVAWIFPNAPLFIKIIFTVASLSVLPVLYFKDSIRRYWHYITATLILFVGFGLIYFINKEQLITVGITVVMSIVIGLLVNKKVKFEKGKDILIKHVDFVSTIWHLNPWGGKVVFRDARKMLFKGKEVKHTTGTDVCYCDLPNILLVNRLYKFECIAKARTNNATGEINLWCHDNIEVPNIPIGISDSSGVTKITIAGTAISLYFIPRNSGNVRIHLEYKPGEGEIEVKDGVNIYLTN